ncbi:prenyltransferase/squalene oxidase repeat-containing protein [Paramaledivibacter caminithermalis]|jgi:hypothetical protein|uniref:Prenyltransferase alpha-alpha toroid domain-containing protein n=1 Tax=Paramaledivibacter caminithermalis (strain DSM 15212 / CIP 107654 / DViRD3) TaxID=1121301 RepID=A0A1M6R8W7_PARC5|nr:terpene cyclase/mutase family protein [Paramaledivibacter caminithermalis]SHK28880.1 hypothetical protein SAMN02745912_02880 [Paramaledivibacter caminithermalis DSM 15212]
MVRKVFRILLAIILIINIISINCISFAENNKNDKEIIENAIKDLRNYYEDDDEYSFREAIALNFTSKDIDKEIKEIADRLDIKESDSAATYAGNIIGIIAAGKDPKNFKGKNYVKLLLDSQEESGWFITNLGDKHPATLAWSIIALDMAEAKYDIEKAITALMKAQKDHGGFTVNPDVDTAAMAITALAEHKDIEGVKDTINKAIDFIKSAQLDSGGFPFMGSDNPYSICAVIQGLMANEIDPLSNEWQKNGNSMLDALLNFKTENHFEYRTEYGSEKKSATEQAFIALADLYRGKSMYQNVKIYEYDSDNEDEEDNDDKLIMERIGNNVLEKGEEGKVTIRIKNNTEEDQEFTFIVVLYEIDDDEMVTYSYLTKTIEKKEEEIITTGFLIPRKGEYEVRGFLWDNLEDMNILTDPIYIDVE